MKKRANTVLSEYPVIKNGAVIDQKVVFVCADDWVATYIDGRKAMEGHSVDRHTLLKKLGIRFISLPVDQEWLEQEQGCVFPDNLKDCKIQEED